MMNERDITVDRVEVKTQGDKEWLFLYDKEEKKHGIFKNIRDEDGEWHKFPEDTFQALKDSTNKAIKLYRVKNEKGYFSPIDADFFEGKLPPPTKPINPPLQPGEPPESHSEGKEPNPQAVGMIIKEIGEMIRDKYLLTIFGEDAANELVKWYRGQTLGITRIPFDGAKLPRLYKKE